MIFLAVMKGLDFTILMIFLTSPRLARLCLPWLGLCWQALTESLLAFFSLRPCIEDLALPILLATSLMLRPTDSIPRALALSNGGHLLDHC